MARYVSTRGGAPELDFTGVLLAGLAEDGGLYLPAEWPRIEPGHLTRWRDLPYAEVAAEVMWPFVEGSIDRDRFVQLVADSYTGFDAAAVVPMRPLGDHRWLAELFWGPTLAFKDIALQLVGRLFDHELARRGERITIVGATSGDTGSAAIEACRDREAIEIFILHPAGRVSEVQRRQMTTVASANVHNIAVEGTFDDCQDLVKALFADTDLRDRLHLSAVNSINWARVMAQTVYYVTAALAVGGPDRPVSFTVPTGNFGNIFAGDAARRMGAPVGRLVMASNRNDILTRFWQTGTLAVAEVHPTLSPSMDIQISSNLERLLFELSDRDAPAVTDVLERFRREGQATVPATWVDRLRGGFDADRLDDEETSAVIREMHTTQGVILDPHTAVGVGAALRRPADAEHPMVCLATAHPAKFPDAVEAATGVRPALPERLADLLERPERYVTLPASLDALRDHLLGLSTSPPR